MQAVRFVLVSLALAASGSAFATPMLVAHQGRVFGPDGEPLEGDHVVTFAIYPTRDAVAPVWTDDLTLEFVEGFYATLLGDTPDNPLDDFVFDGGVLFLDIAIDASEPLQPRQAIASVPYAIRADVASRVEGGTIDALSLAIDGTEVIDEDGHWVGPVPTVTFDDLGGLPTGLESFAALDASCFDGDVAKWDDTPPGWTCAPDDVLTESEVDAHVADNGYAMDAQLALVAKSGSYNDLNGRPSLSGVAITGDYDDLIGAPALSAVATTGDYDDLTDTPALHAVATSGDYDDLDGLPGLSAVATSGDYDDLVDTPVLATVATSGDYGDLANTPSYGADAPLVLDGTVFGLDVPTCGTGQVLTWNGSDLLCQAAVPTGAILFFPGACPSGWTEYTALRGRVPLGLPSGGSGELTRGTALGNNGARSITDVPSHTHGIDPPSTTTSSAGSHAHNINTRQDDWNVSGGNGPSWGADNGTYTAYHGTETAGSHTHTLDVAAFTSDSAGVSSVEVTMPYIQLRACQAP